jgi:hypothetical protein
MTRPLSPEALLGPRSRCSLRSSINDWRALSFGADHANTSLIPYTWLMTQHLPHESCDTCGSLADREEAFYKAGQDTGNTSLPPAAQDLILVDDRTGVSSRAKQLKRCPQCETYYWFWTDYEFLVGGTEDEQFLIRLAPEQLSEYLEEPTNPSRPLASSPPSQAEVVVQIPLAQDAFHQLRLAYEIFEAAKRTYEEALEQRYWRPAEESPPPQGMEKLHEAVKDAWSTLCGLLEQQNLRETAYANMVLPKRMKGGRRTYRRLIKWLANGYHQQQSLVPILAKHNYRQLLQELLHDELNSEWRFGQNLRPGPHTDRGLPQPDDTATIVSSHIPIPYYTGFFVVDFSKEEVRLMAVDQKTPAEQHWQLQPPAGWWPRAYCCDWPVRKK